MDAVLSREAVPSIKPQVAAAELIAALEFYAPQIDVVSLDCFDTLLWRRAALPIDVFYDLQNKPTFKACGITAGQRINAERYARHVLFAREQVFEVTLHDIYRIGFPLIAEDQREHLIAEEIATEIEHCYGFPPVMELIRAARALQKKVIIVSNTYLTEEELRQLLTAVLPDDIIQAIAHIFCSSAFSRAKTDGLFQDVLQKLAIPANKILHLGDNKEADFDAPRALGLHALHFLQYEPKLAELLRAEAMAALMVEPSLRHTRSFTHPFRGVLASADALFSQPENVIGYASLGPILYCFAQYLHAEAQHIAQPKFLFMLRDGYMLAKACAAFSDKTAGKQVNVSRFSAIAASFYTADDVKEFVGYGLLNSIDIICHQLLLPPEVINTLATIANASAQPKQTLIKLLAQDDILEIVLQNSRIHRDRLKRYLQQYADIQPNDTVVLVDIGYSGTVQKFLTPFLLKEFPIRDVLGRYLMSMTAIGKNPKQAGLIDDAFYDERIMNMLYQNCVLFEELCCNDEKTTLSYQDDLTLLTAAHAKKPEQHEKIKKIQAAALRFIDDTKAFFQPNTLSLVDYGLRDVALAEMSRAIYFPTAAEIQCLQGLEHDVNMGTEDVVKLVNTPDADLQKLQIQGLQFRGKYLPTGLRTAGLELSAFLLLQHKLGLEMNLEDLSLQREAITLLATQNNHSNRYTLQVAPTRDGYFSLWVPFAAGQAFHFAILFGLHYKFVQVHSMQLIPMRFFLRHEDPEAAVDIMSTATVSHMLDKGGGLLECVSPEAALLVAPHAPTQETWVFRLVFRPVVR